eukprot:Seg755.3 transcript_id=Seg755.3/GoldUCD/mRNA.D3Y31 product="hypothetical protein" protein_id=Seg755.3/GoldUCD/D3Y31
MSRMPRAITLQIARLMKEEVWPIDEILGVVRKEIEAREISDSVASLDVKRERPVTANRPRSPSATTKSFFAKGEKQSSQMICYFCKQSHISTKCPEITDFKERKKILQASNRCFSCLKTGHNTTHCPANRNCRKCGGKFHHQSICFKETQQAETDQSNQGESTVTATVNGKNEVLLQTAQGYVYGEDKSKKIPVNILFDGGSQRSYMTGEVQRKLKLNAEGTETINLNTFGSQKSERKKCDLVRINLDVDGEEQPINIAALCYPTICSPISSRIDLSDYPHLLGLRFADRNLGERNKRIDLLIGADYLYNVIIGEVVRGTSGPVAVSSKLGWLITGQTFSDTLTCSNVTSNLTLDQNIEVVDIPDSEIQENETNENDSQEITDSLKEFWKHESLGVSEPGDSDKEADDGVAKSTYPEGIIL